MLIKINLPKDESGYETGNGEGCWAEIDGDALEAYDADGYGSFTATLDNFSIYWPLGAGDEVPIELRGKNRPVVPIGWLMSK